MTKFDYRLVQIRTAYEMDELSDETEPALGPTKTSLRVLEIWSDHDEAFEEYFHKTTFILEYFKGCFGNDYESEVHYEIQHSLAGKNEWTFHCLASTKATDRESWD